MKTNRITVWSLAGGVFVVLFVIGYGLAKIIPADDSNNAASTIEIGLEPQNSSVVHGTAIFEDMPSGGVEVRLKVGGLRNRTQEHETLYLAHIHAGTCAQGEEKEDYKHDSHEGGEEGEIEYPLSPIDSDAQGKGRSVTTLRDTSLDKLFSGDPKHLNVHAAGSGDPPVLTCGDLKGGGR